jgi:hypothetical protein
MATPFGAPIYNEHEAEDPSLATAGDQAQEVIDPNDPRFTSENVDVNTEADAYAFPPPPPDARYRAKLKMVQRDDAQKQKVDWIAAKWGATNPQYVLVTSVEASIIDPSGKFDGYKVYDRNVSTFQSRDHGTKVATILARLKRPDGTPWVNVNNKPKTTKEWMELLRTALAGEPEIMIDTNWEWSCAGCGQESKKAGTKYAKSIVGMHKFPQFRGQFQPEMRCQVNPAHGESRAQVRIARFLGEQDLKPKS